LDSNEFLKKITEDDPQTMELVTYCIYSMAFSVADHMRQFKKLIERGVIPVDGFRPLMAGYVARTMQDSIRAYGSIEESLAAAKKEFGEITMEEAMAEISRIASESLGITEGFESGLDGDFERPVGPTDAIRWGGI